MLATSPRVHQYPGAVPALLAWAHGESERLPEFVATFCAEATSLHNQLAAAVTASDAQEVYQAACRLRRLLAHVGVPQLYAVAAALEDLARTKDLGPAVSLVEELGAVLPGFCAYLARKPWLRY